jgi:predicted ABC-type ATPase
MNSKKIIIIAGPNGAGKTTFAKAFLPNEANCTAFINADLIAAGIAPFAPESAAIAAGRIMLDLIKKYVESSTSFAFETTLSGLGYARMIPKWQALGYFVQLYFIGLSSCDLAVERVAHRVKHGGHHIHDDVVRRRYTAGLKNFHEIYKPLVNKWTLFDNDGIDTNAVDWG